jgi:4-alpha-glucanotransferase
LHPTSLESGTFASAYDFIDWLAAAGQSWWQVLPLGPPDHFGSPYAAHSAFAGNPQLLARPRARVSKGEIEDFRSEHAYWIEDWASYAGEGAIEDQVRFSREWGEIRGYANERGVRILGDIPFYVAGDSADYASHRAQFDDAYQAGVPPDMWSRTGQLWGNPIYDWAVMRRLRFSWWTERIRRCFELVDALRIDHFRGFVAYWVVPKANRTAIAGRWVRGPGASLFEAASAELGPLALVAENLGLITPAVERLRTSLGIPGTIVLQFEFERAYRPDDKAVDNVVYTGTHDNDTSLGWWKRASARERSHLEDALARAGIVEERPAQKLVKLALRHPAKLCIIPAQDLLDLGNEARMNTPGTAGGNWQWRLSPGSLSRELGAELRAMTADAGRLPKTA